MSLTSIEANAVFTGAYLGMAGLTFYASTYPSMRERPAIKHAFRFCSCLNFGMFAYYLGQCAPRVIHHIVDNDSSLLLRISSIVTDLIIIPMCAVAAIYQAYWSLRMTAHDHTPGRQQ